jgi:thioredoxin reductase (NADPH)
MHALVQTDAEISEVLMRTLIHRRVALVAQGISDVLLIGSVGSGATPVVICRGEAVLKNPSD